MHPDIQIVALGKRRADVLLVLVPKCEPCGGKLKFTFNNGAAQSELRIFADFSGNQWRWDSFKLVSADPVQEQSIQKTSDGLRRGKFLPIAGKA